MTPAELEAPVLVVRVDLTFPETGLSAIRTRDVRYTAARVLVTHGTSPLGMIDLPLEATPLADDLAGRLGISDAPRVAPRQSSSYEYLPFTSVVVPSIFMRLEHLEQSVRALSELDHPDFEVVVVDNRRIPDPASWAPLLALPRVRVVAEPKPGISAARNRGVREARGEIVAFTDDDVRVDPQWLQALSARFVGEPTVDCVTGLVVAGELETAPQLMFERYDDAVGTRFDAETYRLTDARARLTSADRYTVLAQGPDGRARRTFWLYQLGGFMGANMAFRASALAATGPFDEALGTGTATKGGEDLDMLARILTGGRRIGYEPSAMIWHTHRRTYDELHAQMWGYGVGFTAMLAATVWRDPRHLVGLARAVLTVLAARLRSRPAGPHAADGLPAELRSRERRGMTAGPWNYLRTRLRDARL